MLHGRVSQSSVSKGSWLEDIRGLWLSISEWLGNSTTEKLNRPEGIGGKLTHEWVEVSNAKGSKVNEPENLHMGRLKDVSNDGLIPKMVMRLSKLTSSPVTCMGSCILMIGPGTTWSSETTTDNSGFC